MIFIFFFTADQILGRFPTGGQSHRVENKFLSITIKTSVVLTYVCFLKALDSSASLNPTMKQRRCSYLSTFISNFKKLF